ARKSNERAGKTSRKRGSRFARDLGQIAVRRSAPPRREDPSQAGRQRSIGRAIARVANHRSLGAGRHSRGAATFTEARRRRARGPAHARGKSVTGPAETRVEPRCRLTYISPKIFRPISFPAWTIRETPLGGSLSWLLPLCSICAGLPPPSKVTGNCRRRWLSETTRRRSWQLSGTTVSSYRRNWTQPVMGSSLSPSPWVVLHTRAGANAVGTGLKRRSCR